MFPAACIHGRFQILHNDHIAYFQLAAKKYGRLYIGITGQANDVTGPGHRGALLHNPLSYWERVAMWQAFLAEAGEEQHMIGPFPIERPRTLPDFVPRSCVCSTTVRDEWNLEKIDRLKRMGYTVDVLLTDFAKSLQGVMVRKLIYDGSKEWKRYVPQSVFAFLMAIDIESRLRRMS
jgi:nicotinamide-nucleotide adenylyltransferase